VNSNERVYWSEDQLLPRELGPTLDDIPCGYASGCIDVFLTTESGGYVFHQTVAGTSEPGQAGRDLRAEVAQYLNDSSAMRVLRDAIRDHRATGFTFAFRPRRNLAAAERRYQVEWTRQVQEGRYP
jgi:hypothetical protein